jgi:2,3-bisphosphoglycerate-independent phosphoglycerate mutase
MRSLTPLILMILDGWGYSSLADNNSIQQAMTPTWDNLWQSCPHVLLSASGQDVGLPPGQMGNSEVGHMTIGAGRIIYQDLSRINNAIANASFFSNAILLHALKTAQQKNRAVHVLGLLSNGGIHSHTDHIQALIKMAQMNNVEKIYLHAFLDGRDTPPQSASRNLEEFSPYIVSIMGRFYAMDRDQRFERTQKAIDLLVYGAATYHAADALTGLNMAYARGETDEFVQPTQIKKVCIQADDLVIVMNFRADRARQLCYELLKAVPTLKNNLLSLTEYDSDLPAQVIFPPQRIDSTLSEILSTQQLTQLHIAETEKYAHVTFFFNAGKEDAVSGEERILVPSPKVATYDLVPEMNTPQITEQIIAAIEQQEYDIIICNFANADMVGHTGNLIATIQAIQTIDTCLGKIIIAMRRFGGQMLITSDHGNAEVMWDAEHQQPHTAHTTNLVPFVYVGPQQFTFKHDKVYGLQDVAPTILQLLNIAQPSAMTGVSLIDDKQ